jgi:hypothetical protein
MNPLPTELIIVLLLAFIAFIACISIFFIPSQKSKEGNRKGNYKNGLSESVV